MKTLFRNSTHINSKSHDCLICEINGKKVKMTYIARNAHESCDTQLFDGDKWNHFLSMLDMGVIEESSAYNIWDTTKRKKRADDLFKKSEIMCKSII